MNLVVAVVLVVAALLAVVAVVGAWIEAGADQVDARITGPSRRT